MSSAPSAAADLWEIFKYLEHEPDVSLHLTLDEMISNRLQSVNQVIQHHSSIVNISKLLEYYPKTKKKLNDLLISNKNFLFPDWFVSSLSLWLNQSSASLLLHKWLEDDTHKHVNVGWLLEHAEKDNSLYIKIFDKLVRSCKNSKSDAKIKEVTKLFGALDTQFLQEACDILTKATPSVSVCLLHRCSDIEDKYVIAGLKALSKLSRQKSIDFKIDFSLLEKLGPKARLDVMKQLLGLCNRWRRANKELPFVTTPSREGLEKFLFPASFKYNKEVSDVLQKFDEFLNPKKDEPKYKNYYGGMRRY